MSLWFVFALMTAAAIFAVLWPLGRAGRPQHDASEAAVYKDQLSEIDRDVAAGLIGRPEAEAARVEISRRLLAAADNQRDPPVASNIGLRRLAAVTALVGLPIVAVALYLPLGSPQLGDFPLAQRIREPDATQPLDNLVAQVEQHLEKNPTDGRGWNVLAPVLSDDAVAAAKDMNEADRGAMIRGMVERLASRLKQNGDDVEGWLRLVRAYMVMGDRDKAKSALTEARQAVANDAQRLRQLNEGLKNLGLDG